MISCCRALGRLLCKNTPCIWRRKAAGAGCVEGPLGAALSSAAVGLHQRWARLITLAILPEQLCSQLEAREQPWVLATR